MNTKIKTLLFIMIAFLIMRYIYFVAVTGYKGFEGDFIKVYYPHTLDLAEIKNNSPEEKIYNLLRDGRATRGSIVYFPLFYLGLTQLFKIGKFGASLVWLLFNQLIFIFSLYLLIKAIKPRLSLIEFSLTVFIVTNFLPVEHNILGGQTSFLTLISLTGCLYFLQRKREFLAGILLALGVLLKWTPVFFLILLIWKKRYRCILSFILFMISMFSVSILRFGLKTHYIQLLKVIPEHIFRFKGLIINHSVSSVFQRLFSADVGPTTPILHLPLLADFLSYTSILIFLFLTLRKIFSLGREMTENFPFEFAFFVSALLLISNWVAIYHLVWQLIPLLVVFLNIEKIKARQVWMFVASFILLGLEYWPDGIEFTHHGLGVIFLSGRAIGIFLLWLGYYEINPGRN